MMSLHSCATLSNARSRGFMSKIRERLLGVCVFLLLAGTAAIAQTITASIRGTVSEASGAIVERAEVRATNVGTGTVSKMMTNHSGSYNFQFLPIGTYKVEVTAPGFRNESIGPFTLEIDQVAQIDAKLQVGQATESMTVSEAAAPILNTENATLGTSIDANTLESMPLNGLNPYIAAMIVPGALNPTFAAMGGLEGAYRDTDQDAVPSFNGNRKQGNNFILDGIEINETVANTVGYNPSPYSLQEMRIITGNADAEYGNVNGGEVVMVTKGGTNRFHGNLFEYFKNQGLSANSWTNDYNGVAKSHFSQNQFGATLGGPILKDKLFFFADYEGLRYTVPASQSLYSVPDALERAGNFSELLSEPTPIQLYNTAQGNTDSAVPYANNQLPAVLNPVATYLFAHPTALPLPNRAPLAGTVAQNNYLGYSASQNTNNQVDGRLDYTIGTRDTLMVKGTWGDAHDEQTQTPLPILFPATNDYPFYMGAVNWTHTFSPSLVNQLRAGYSRIGQRASVSDPTGLFGTKGNALVGIPLATQAVPGFSQIAIAGSEIGGFGTSIAAGNTTVDNNFDYSDDFTWVHGHHVTRLGVQFIRYQENYFNPTNLGGLLGTFGYNGSYTAAGSSNGDGFADFELNDAQSVQVSGQSGPFGQRQWRDAYYVQDDWKLLPNLTINIGLRYAYDQQLYEVHNKMLSVDLKKAYFAPVNTPASSLLLYAGQNGNNRSLVNPAYTQFMPRVGFAWQPQPGVVFRGGYGISDDIEGTGSGLRMTQNAPFLTSYTNNATTPSTTSQGTPIQVQTGFTSTSASTSSQYDVWDPSFRPALVQQFNFTTQMQIARLTSAQLGYVGQLGQHLAVPILLNQYTGPVPTSCPGDTTGCVDLVAPYYALVGGNNQIAETASRAISNYNAFQATLRQQETNGLEFTVNYTWSKSMTNNPGGFFNVDGTLGGLFQFWQNTYNSHQDYGNSAFDVPHNLNATGVYKLPFGRGKRFGGDWGRLTDETLGGWELATNVLLGSGFPISLYQNGNDNLNTAADSYNYNGYSTVNQYFKPRIVNRSTAHWFGTDPSATPCTIPGARINSLGVPCAYGRPAFNQFGNLAPNSARAPGSKDVDLSLFKAFRTRGEQNIKFRADAFNAFNMVSLAPPRSRIGSSTYGRITSALSAPRQFQFSAIYQF